MPTLVEVAIEPGLPPLNQLIFQQESDPTGNGVISENEGRADGVARRKSRPQPHRTLLDSFKEGLGRVFRGAQRGVWNVWIEI